MADARTVQLDITVVAMTWDREVYRVRNLLWTLHNQSLPPAQAIIVDQTPSQPMQDASKGVCDDYGALHISTPSQEFSMPRAFNTALHHTTTQYVMFTGIDMMLSENFLRTLNTKLSPTTFVCAMMGYFPKIFYIGSGDFYSRWEGVVKVCDPALITRALSPGACQAMSTEWLKSVNGYDERYSGGLGGIDDEMRTRAIKAGLDVVWIEWEEAQVVHLWHKKSKLKDTTSHLFDADPPVIANTGGTP